MVSIDIQGSTVVVTPQGLHKLWAVKNEVRVDLDDIEDVRLSDYPRWQELGLRLPGTALPGFLAGSYRHPTNGWSFLNVSKRKDSAIELKLKGGNKYRRIVVDVEDPQGAVAQVREAAGLS